MLFPMVFVLFAAVAAAADEKRECIMQVWKKCDVEKSPEEIPETMEDLKRDCLIVQGIAKCISEEYAKCDSDDTYTSLLGKLALFLESSCTEESSLYQALSRNYECIQPIAGIAVSQCEPSEEDWAEIHKIMSKAGQAELTVGRCGHALYEITCTAHVVGVRCGQEAKEVVTEILQNTKFHFQSCNNESTLRELQPLRELFESTFTEAPELENELLEELKEALDK